MSARKNHLILLSVTITAGWTLWRLVHVSSHQLARPEKSMSTSIVQLDNPASREVVPGRHGCEPSNGNLPDQVGGGTGSSQAVCLRQYLRDGVLKRCRGGPSVFTPCDMAGYYRGDWKKIEEIVTNARADPEIVNSLGSALTERGSVEFLKVFQVGLTDREVVLVGSPILRALCVEILSFIRTEESARLLRAALANSDTPNQVRLLIPKALGVGEVLDGVRWEAAMEEWRQLERRARADPNLATSALRPRLLDWRGPDGLVFGMSVVVLPDGIKDNQTRDTILKLALDASEDYSVRRSAVEVLRWSMNADPVAYDPLREALLRVEDSDPKRRNELRTLVEEALPRTWAQYFAEVELRLVSHDRLVSILADPRETDERRRAAARSVAQQTSDPESIRAAIDTLLPVAMGEKVQSVREDVAWILTSLPPSEWGYHNMNAYLRGLRYEPNSSLRSLFVSNAADILGNKNDARRAREDLLRSDPDSSVRLRALNALSEENDGIESLPVLEEVIQSDPSEIVRLRASLVLDDLRTRSSPSKQE